jgi:hypothetical protein
MKRAASRRVSRSLISLVWLLSITGLIVFAQGATPPPSPATEHFALQTVVLGDGMTVERSVINGPPVPPIGYERAFVELPEPSRETGISILPVPAYDWSFGCSATSAAMIAAYYDRTSYPDMYTGPTNGGVMPLDNSVWPDWYDGYEWRNQCPLSATHNGLDGRATRGHVDDYWIRYGAPGPDPYTANGWAEHTAGDCTGDYMKTNKWFGTVQGFNYDGGTVFYNYPSGAPLYAATMEAGGIHVYDGGYGFKLFYESRGYAVTTMYNQYIRGAGSNPSLGFTYDQYKSEIDAGRPVMIHVQGHTMVGVGYDDSASNLMYIHDTWDYVTHTMQWGGSYAGMDHYAVTIVQLEAVAPGSPGGLIATAFSPSRINLAWNDNSWNESGFRIERSPDSPGAWTEIDTVGPNAETYRDLGLSGNTTYFYRVRAYNTVGYSGYSNEAHDTTLSGSQHRAYVPVVFSGAHLRVGGTENWSFEDGPID